MVIHGKKVRCNINTFNYYLTKAVKSILDSKLIYNPFILICVYFMLILFFNILIIIIMSYIIMNEKDDNNSAFPSILKNMIKSVYSYIENLFKKKELTAT